MIKYFMGELKLWREILMSRLGRQDDFVGYETLIEYIKRRGIDKLEGDFMEIGAFMGGGSRKLAKYAQELGKSLIVVDIFLPNFDQTMNERGEKMNWIYTKILGRRNLRKIFYNNVNGLQNVMVYEMDSRILSLPIEQTFCFSFIDGNHDPGYVKSDFSLIWRRTVSGGVVAFHDYGGDLPQTTQAIDDLIDSYGNQISRLDINGKKCIIFIEKR